MIREKTVEEYLGLPDDCFGEKEINNAHYLWGLLFQAEPFTEEEQENARLFVRKFCIDGLLVYGMICNHLDEELYDEIVTYYEQIIMADLENGYLLDMIIDYFTDRQFAQSINIKVWKSIQNKRIGVYVMLTFLEINGIRLDCTNEDIVQIGLGVADGSVDYKALLAWVREHRV